MGGQVQQGACSLPAVGEEQVQTIRVEADRALTVILAEAERDAQKLRGEVDAQATRIYGEAANRYAGCYAFQRSLEAYRAAFEGGDSVIVLDSSDPFLQDRKSTRLNSSH